MEAHRPHQIDFVSLFSCVERDQHQRSEKSAPQVARYSNFQTCYVELALFHDVVCERQEKLHALCSVIWCLSRRPRSREIILESECLRLSCSSLRFNSLNIASKIVPAGGWNSSLPSVAFLVSRSNIASSMPLKCVSSFLSNSTSVF